MSNHRGEVMFKTAFSDLSKEDQDFYEHQDFLRYNHYFNEIYLFCELCKEADKLK